MKSIHEYLTKYRLFNSEKRRLIKFTRQIKSEYKLNVEINKKQKIHLYNQITGFSPFGKLSGFKLKYAIATLTIIAFSLVSVVAVAQKSQPGDNLYSIKKASQTIRLWIQPSYIKDVVKDSKLETEKLIEENAPERDVEEAKREYRESVEKAIDSGYSTQIKQDINSSIIENNTNSNVENYNNYDGTNGGGPVENNTQPTPTNSQLNQNNKLN